MLHPVRFNPEFNPELDIRDIVASRAGAIKYPKDAILFMQANRGLVNLAKGNKNPFLSNVLGPQYVLNADGSYSNAGAVAPVDVIGGRKMLRTCGAVTNLVPNSECVGAGVGVQPIGWDPVVSVQSGINTSVVGGGDGYVDVRLQGTATALIYPGVVFAPSGRAIAGVVGDIFTASCKVELVSGVISNPVRLGIREYNSSVGYIKHGSGVVTLGTIGSLTRTLDGVGCAIVSADIILQIANGETVDFTLRISKPQLTKSAYPLPYVPTRGASVTMPASHATTTNGPWFGLPQYDDAETADGLFKRDRVELNTFEPIDVITTTAGTPLRTRSNLSLSEKYMVTLKVDAISGGTLNIYCQNPTQTAVIITPGTYSLVSNPTGVNSNMAITPAASGMVIKISSISVQKLIPATKTNRVWAALDGEPDGVELVTNGGFDSWAGDNPTGWVVSAETANEYVTEVSGAARIVSTTGNYIDFSQQLLVVGNRYVVSFDIVAHPVGTLVLFSGASSIALYVQGVVGRQQIVFTATNTQLGFKRSATLDATIDNVSIQRIQPRPMTLAWRGVMGVGSGDIVDGTYAIISEKADNDNTVLRFTRYSDPYGAVTRDGVTNSAVPSLPWQRNATILRFAQVATTTNQFRAGWLIAGTHTNIVWDSWRSYDGSFNPSNLYKLLLGFGNTTPIWHDTIALWNKQVDDATLLKEMLK